MDVRDLEALASSQASFISICWLRERQTIFFVVLFSLVLSQRAIGMPK